MPFVHAVVSYYDSLLHPLMERDLSAKQRVKFFTGCAATRIKIVNKVATGVECIDMKSSIAAPFIINASKEVILCAGAIVSPTLFILSGVGDRNKIDHAGMSPYHAHIPAVGKNLREHILLPRAITSLNQRYIRNSMNSVQAKSFQYYPFLVFLVLVSNHSRYYLRQQIVSELSSATLKTI
jgi:choline dehydrogenase-like flavoprotein